MSWKSKTGWSATADSQFSGSYIPAYVYNGSLTTGWAAANTAPPHWIDINLGSSQTIGGLLIYARGDGNSSGFLKDYEIYVSSDGVNWGSAVASGTAPYTPPGSTWMVAWTPVTGQYLRIKATSAAYGTGGSGTQNYPWIAEVEIGDGTTSVIMSVEYAEVAYQGNPNLVCSAFYVEIAIPNPAVTRTRPRHRII